MERASRIEGLPDMGGRGGPPEIRAGKGLPARGGGAWVLHSHTQLGREGPDAGHGPDRQRTESA
jgi:hypothetical protein